MCFRKEISKVWMQAIPKDELAGKSLAEQGFLAGTQEKKGEFMTFGRRGGPLRRTTRML